MHATIKHRLDLALAKIGRRRIDQARAIGVTVAAIHHWLSGRSPIAPVHAARIEMLSGGAIRADELRPDIAFMRVGGVVYIGTQTKDRHGKAAESIEGAH